MENDSCSEHHEMYFIDLADKPTNIAISRLWMSMENVEAGLK